MTKVEVLGLIIGSVGAVAAIVAAWASVAERMEKRRERIASELSPEEEAIVFLASRQSDKSAKVGPYLGGSGFLVTPGMDGRCLVIASKDALTNLETFGLVVSVGKAVSMSYGPMFPGASSNYQPVDIYRLTLKGRERVLKIPADVVYTTIQKSGLDWQG